MKHLSWDEAWELAERWQRVGEMDNTVLQHVEGCTACRHLVEQAQELIEALKNEAELPQRVQENADDEKLWQGISQRIGQGGDGPGHTKGRRNPRSRYRLHWGSSWSAVAAAIMIGAVGVGWYSLHDHGSKTPTRSSEMQSPLATIRSGTSNTSLASGSNAKNAAGTVTSSGVAGMTRLHQPGAAPVYSGLMATSSIHGALRIHVIGQVGGQGEPLHHAQVAVLSRAGVVWSGSTDENGNVATGQVEVPSRPWSSAVRGLQGKISGEATVVVWKTGYTSYVEMGVPVFGNEKPSTVQVRLSPSNHMNLVTGTMAPLPKTDVMALGSVWSTGTSKPATLSADAHQMVIDVHVTSPQGRVLQSADVSWLSVNGLVTDGTNAMGVAHLAVAQNAGAALSPACLPSSVWTAAGKPMEGVFQVSSSRGSGLWVGFVKGSDDIGMAVPSQKPWAPFELSESLPIPDSMVELIWKYVQANVK